MKIDLHAPSRRELLLASGVLFAWAYVPKVAQAEGRDPRFLTIVLRGALDGHRRALGPGSRVNPKNREAFAVGPMTPLIVRGGAPVLSWTPPRLPPASNDTMMRLVELYRHTDPALARVLEERIGLAAIA